jgi:preprotein translocase subunit SecA
VVPLIIARSTQQDEMGEVYRQAARIAARLDDGPDYKIDFVRRKADLKRRGEHRAEQMWDELDEPIWRATRRAEELVRQALIAKHCYLKGQQYAIVEGHIVIVDEYTGRFLPDRSWEHGLHQAVEAKEGLEVTADRETLARLSFQRFFRMYPFLCGMTGTAADATREMERVYGRAVLAIPTNRPVIREQRPMRIFKTAAAKWDAVADSIAELHAAGRPVLVGTRSIASSEHLSRLLTGRGLHHQVLNANFDKDEADVIAGAGHGTGTAVLRTVSEPRGSGLVLSNTGPSDDPPQPPRFASITVATNMAGRGTDIKLDDAAQRAGGLHVILTEMHSAKRIDRQFIGRAGRQGDPGSAQIFVSLEDELVRQHAPALAAAMSARPGADEGTGAVTQRVFQIAQERAQTRDRRNRAAVMRQDDWIDKYLPGG